MRNSPLKINEEVKTLKLNVTTIRSILIAENKRKEKLKDESEIEQKKKKSFEKLKDEEKNLEKKKKIPVVSGVTSKVKDAGTNILDKILNFGGLILAGILVNNLPKIIETVRDIIDSIVNFLTPIQSGFNLIKGILSGDINQSKYDADKKRFDDSLSQLSEKGGLIDQIAEKAGPLEGLIKLLKPAVDVFRNLAGGKDKVLAVKDGQEGVKNTTTGEFTPRQFTQAERSKYIQSGGKGLSGYGPDGRRLSGYGPDGRRLSEDSSSGSMADSPDLKTAIRRAESGNDYGATFRAYLDGFSRRNEDITNMSINEVVQYQKDYIEHQRRLGIPAGQRSAAVGAYQMLYPEVAASKTGVPLTARFSKENQDKMVDYYLNMAGYQKFINNKISAEEFNNRLAGQFASLKTTSGSGVYDTDGINKAYEDLLDLIKKSKPQPKSSGLSNYGSNYKEEEKMLFESVDKYKKNKTEVSINQPIDDDDEEESNLIIAVQPITNVTYLPIPIG